MAHPTSRAELKAYIKRRLGEPVITVNVEDTQLDDRISDALALYQDYHYDAVQPVYLKHQMTASAMVISNVVGTFANNENIMGGTSNVAGIVHTQTSNTVLEFTYRDQADLNIKFTVGETLTGLQSGATATVGTITLGDIDNEYIPLANTITGISKVLPLGGFAGQTGMGTGMFSFQYQYLLQDMGALRGGSIISYYMTRQHMEMLHDLFVGDVGIRFNRHMNRLFLDIDWQNEVRPGQYIIAEATAVVDPDEFNDVWSDRYLRDYATALVKKQWGQNLLKYQGVQMPGGITINGQQLYDEGNREAMELEQKIRDSYELPPGFFMA